MKLNCKIFNLFPTSNLKWIALWCNRYVSIVCLSMNRMNIFAMKTYLIHTKKPLWKEFRPTIKVREERTANYLSHFISEELHKIFPPNCWNIVSILNSQFGFSVRLDWEHSNSHPSISFLSGQPLKFHLKTVWY